MKVKSSVQPRCPYCYVVVRRQGAKLGKKGMIKKATRKIVYVYCSVNPRHKQRQG